MWRALRRWGWRDWLVLAALAGVVIVSWLPWFGEAVGGSDGQTVRIDASAWTASTQWTIAVLLAAVAGVGRAGWSRWVRSRSLCSPRSLRTVRAPPRTTTGSFVACRAA